MELTADRLTVTIEALREYRLRVDLGRRQVIESMIMELLTELAQRTTDVNVTPSEP